MQLLKDCKISRHIATIWSHHNSCLSVSLLYLLSVWQFGHTVFKISKKLFSKSCDTMCLMLFVTKILAEISLYSKGRYCRPTNWIVHDLRFQAVQIRSSITIQIWFCVDDLDFNMNLIFFWLKSITFDLKLIFQSKLDQKWLNKRYIWLFWSLSITFDIISIYINMTPLFWYSLDII